MWHKLSTFDNTATSRIGSFTILFLSRGSQIFWQTSKSLHWACIWQSSYGRIYTLWKCISYLWMNVRSHYIIMKSRPLVLLSSLRYICIYTYMHINILIDVTPNIHLLHCIRLRVWGCNKNVGARILRLTLIATYFCSTAKLWIFRYLFEYYIYVDVWRNYENNVILNGWCTIWHVLWINFGINLMFRLE